jgi:predicted Zn-dependent peptidase
MDARSFHLESWQRDGLQYFVVGDVAPEDLRALANFLNTATATVMARTKVLPTFVCGKIHNHLLDLVIYEL